MDCGGLDTIIILEAPSVVLPQYIPAVANDDPARSASLAHNPTLSLVAAALDPVWHGVNKVGVLV